MSENSFAFTTWVRTTPSALCETLTVPELTRRWWWSALESTWVTGATCELVQDGPRVGDDETVVLDCERPTRRYFAWHTFTHA